MALYKKNGKRVSKLYSVECFDAAERLLTLGIFSSKKKAKKFKVKVCNKYKEDVYFITKHKVDRKSRCLLSTKLDEKPISITDIVDYVNKNEQS